MFTSMRRITVIYGSSMQLNKVSPATLCQSVENDMSFSDTSLAACESTQLSQYSQTSLELFSQPSLLSESSTTGCSRSTAATSNSEERREGIMADKIQPRRKQLSKYYMRYISSQSSDEHDKPIENHHGYQAWTKELHEMKENNHIVDEISKATKECTKQIEVTVGDLKASLISDLHQQAILREKERAMSSDKQSLQLKELLCKHTSYTKQEVDNINIKLNECTTRFTKLETQLQNFVTTSQTRFDRLCTLMDELMKEIKTKRQDTNHCPSSNVQCATDEGNSESVRVERALPSPPQSNTLCEIDLPLNKQSVCQNQQQLNKRKRKKQSSSTYRTATINTRSNKENEAFSNTKRLCYERRTAKKPLIGGDVSSSENEESAFLTSPLSTCSIQQLEVASFHRSIEVQRRQALIRTMAPGSDSLLKEIQSILVRGTNSKVN